ncbi:MAG: hypothetical protein A2992_09285 [Elusimicrobia bacterium RIFCSPLOWO2_01_FULL_59_12]|nr:MAG: hypothetical protein A2992_09285 [Elusimicrobia bacterium RIFCSPLOWO2_01_FULL_59_12]
MLSADEALQKILEAVRPLERAETVPLTQAAGRILACDLTARVDLPPFDNSAMDGLAVRAEEVRGASAQAPARLPVQALLAAGAEKGTALLPGQAIKIMTGAPVPEGADAVVMKEWTRAVNGMAEILHAPKPGEHIRRRGEDVRRGETLLPRGSLLRPYEIALLAAQGWTQAAVWARPAAAIVATGSELVSTGTPELGFGQIYNANGPALAAALGRWGVDTIDFGIVPDEKEALRGAFQRAEAEADLLLISGGVSVGDFDWTRILLEELGLQVVFWKVAIKPGKPLLFGIWNGKPVFGLPGNPVSALVCLEEFVRPALEKQKGQAPAHPSYHLQGVLGADFWKEEGRQQCVFCRVLESPSGFQVHVIRPQGSAMVGMACKANALAKIPAEARRLTKGTPVAFRWLK